MEFTAQQIADILKGTIEGNPTISVTTLSKIEDAEKGSLTFLANPKYTRFIYSTNASIVIVNKSFSPDNSINSTLIRVEDAYSAFAVLLEVYNQIKQNKKGISKLASISASANLGENCYVGEFVSIGSHAKIGNNVKIFPQCFIGDNVIIGNNTIVYPGVKIYSDNIIGSDCTFHAGVIIGSDGFGFAPQSDSNYKKIAQIGNVIIEDNVEIGSNSIVDRATLGSTIIRRGVKLDNLIQVAHNVEIGENTIIAAQTGISGTTKIGKNCLIGGQVGIIGHLLIADGVKIAAQSGVGSSIKEEGMMVQGSPSLNISTYQRSYIHFKNLQKIVSRLNELEKNQKKS